MERCPWRPRPRVVASLLALAGALLCLVGPTLPAVAQDGRVLQVWPDRTVGVTSGLLEGSAEHDAAQVLPFGVCCESSSGSVQARTYLHFPLDVFPPGTEILQATLHVYVDAGSSSGEATFGAYRVLESWEEESGGGDPATWPALLTSPIAVETVRLDVVAPALPASTPTATPVLTLSPPSTPAATSTPEATLPTPTPPTSPLLTPTSFTSPLPTPTTRPTTRPTPSPPASTPSAPTPSPPADGPVVTLGQAAGTWLEWDVTALMRAWMAGEVADYGLALASVPSPDADPETAGDLLVARWLATDDPETKPYLIAEFTVHPVTPTPTATPAPILPHAGDAVGWGGAGVLLVGAALLMLGLAVRRR
ncbi:MAG: hypothetical protein ACE5OS_07000 [Anaerolineae bacterium]